MFSLNGENKVIECVDTQPDEAAEIYATVKCKNAASSKDRSHTSFARLLAQLGRRVYTKNGNGYWMKTVEA